MQGYKRKTFYSFIVFFVILGFVYIQKMQAFAKRRELTLSYTLPAEYVSFGKAIIPNKSLSNMHSIFYTGFSLRVLTNLSQARQSSSNVLVKLHAIVDINRNNKHYTYTNSQFKLRFLKHNYISKCVDYLFGDLSSIAINIPLNQYLQIKINNTNFGFTKTIDNVYPPEWEETACFNIQFEPKDGDYGQYNGTITLTIVEG